MTLEGLKAEETKKIELGEEGMKEDRVLGLFLVQLLWSPGPRVGVSEETFCVDVYKAVDFVEHVVFGVQDLSTSSILAWM